MSIRLGFGLIAAALALAVHAAGAPMMPVTPPSVSPAPPDRRAAVPPVDLDTNRTFPTFRTLAEWKARREFIRTQILVSCGLYPLPQKTPLHAQVFDRVERDGYTIEKVA